MAYDMFPDVDGMMPVGEELFGFTATFMVLILLVYFVAMAFAAVSYVLQSLGLFTIAKRRGIRNPWLAWIPYTSVWILGSISDQYLYVTKGEVKNRRKTLVGLYIALGVVLMVFSLVYTLFFVFAVNSVVSGSEGPLIAGGIAMAVVYIAMMVLAVVLSIFQYICTYHLYVSCNPDRAVMYLLLSIFVNVTMPFFVFACRKKDLGMPPRKPQQPEAPVYRLENPVEQEPAEPVEE